MVSNCLVRILYPAFIKLNILMPKITTGVNKNRLNRESDVNLDCGHYLLHLSLGIVYKKLCG